MPKKLLLILFKQVRITNNISNRTYRSIEHREIITLQNKVMSRSELHFFMDTQFLGHIVEIDDPAKRGA